MASQAQPQLPPTPELDKVTKNQETIATLMSFLEHLMLQQDIELATWKPCSVDLHESTVEYSQCSESYHLVPDGSMPYTLIYEYLGIDEETMEVERRTLLNHIQLTT